MMVSEVRERRHRETMAAEVMLPPLPPPPRSHSRLHNFVFPSGNWGLQRKLRCMKVEEEYLSYRRSPAIAADDSCKKRRFSPPSPASSPLGMYWLPPPPPPPRIQDTAADGREVGGGDPLSKIRDKLAAHLRDAVEKINLAAPNEVKEMEESSSVAAAAEEASRPWNLRTRRAACNAPNECGRRQNPSPLAPEKNKSGRFRPEGSEKKERTKFSMSLGREEIEEDYLQLIGSKPPRRPKKRPRAVQRQLDMLFPGTFLSEITSDSYKVPDSPNGF